MRALEQACWCRCWVPLQGAAVRVECVLWSWPAGAAGCRRRVLLLEWSACCGAGLLVPLGAAAGCFRVMLYMLWSWPAGEGAASGCCQSAVPVCGLEMACWCRCRGLQGAALRVVRVLFGACGVPVKTIEKGRNLGTKANPSKSNTCMTFVSNLEFEKH